MAEAQGTPPSAPPTFFCHQCNRNIGPAKEDYTCPSCGSGFIEEDNDPRPQNAASQAGAGLGFGNFMEALAGGHQGFDFADLFGVPGGAGVRLGGRGTGAQGGGNPSSTQGQGGPMNFGGFGMTTSVGPGGVFQLSFGGPSGGSRAQAPGQTSTAGNPGGAENNVEHMLYSFLSDLIHGLGGDNAEGQQQPGIPLLGNLGDYVWGREGLDAIVTQLMNQMEGSGPPPLPTEKLDQLPTVNINQEQVDRKLQCSVCWENFELSEEVKQLECEHVYHQDCILPWLKLHGTCPICRRDFTPGAGKKEGEDSSTPTTERPSSTTASAPSNPRPAQPPGPGGLPGDILNLFNIPGLTPSGGRIPNNTSTQSQSGQNQGRNSSSTRNPPGPPPNLDMDMEFD